ncbi:MAG: hypothetical protein WD467_03370 [Candidatus Saccharimonadales bacterium]
MTHPDTSRSIESVTAVSAESFHPHLSAEETVLEVAELNLSYLQPDYELLFSSELSDGNHLYYMRVLSISEGGNPRVVLREVRDNRSPSGLCAILPQDTLDIALVMGGCERIDPGWGAAEGVESGWLRVGMRAWYLKPMLIDSVTQDFLKVEEAASPPIQRIAFVEN